jgi:hypothetical protein
MGGIDFLPFVRGEKMPSKAELAQRKNEEAQTKAPAAAEVMHFAEIIG